MSAWKDIASAPKDGTLLLLLVDYSGEDADHPLENEVVGRTIGSNSLANDGEDRWNFAGWCWSHDHHVDGRGTPTAWQPLPDAADAGAAGE